MSEHLGQGERQPWGWKMTIHAYGTGPMPPSDAMIEAANRAAEYVGGDDFVGVDCKVIRKRPSDQVAS
jgi:hypothetical protein